MQKPLSPGRALLALCAVAVVALAGSGPARADGEFCLIPPQAHVAAQKPFLTDVWRSLSARVAPRVGLGALPLDTIAAPQTPSTVGNLVALVLLVDFDDTPASRPNFQLRNLFFGTAEDSPVGSVAQYYAENSYGKLQFSGALLGDPRASATDNPDPTQQVKWMRMPHEYSFYANGQFGFGPDPRNAKQLVVDALTAAQQLYPTFDWSQFDQNHDGFVDLLVVAHAGPGAEGSADPSQIWSHRSTITDFQLAPSSPAGANVPLKARDYAMVAEDNNTGVFAHEIGHVLGLPDLYTNPQGLSVGLGYWSSMAAAENIPEDQGPDLFSLRPGHFDPWCKIQLGWITPTVITKSMTGISLPPVETNPVVLKVPANPSTPLEYYLIENRSTAPGTYDGPVTVNVLNPDGTAQQATIGGVPGSGVLIYHVDERRGTNDDRGHLLTVVEEADAGDKDKKTGRVLGFSLLLPENLPLANRGDAGDPFGNTHTQFTFTTNPPAINYDGQDSGVRITNIDLKTAAPNAAMDITVASILGSVFTAGGEALPAYTLLLLDSTGQPVSNPHVQVQGATFTYSDLDPGQYTLKITANGYIPETYPVTKGEGPAALRVFLVQQPPASSVAAGWNMVSFPLDFGGAKVNDVLGQPDLQSFGWDGTQYVANPVVVPGKSYWINFTSPQQFKFAVSGQAVSPEVDYSVPITKGWNLVGDPFPRALTWDPQVFRLKTAAGDDLTLDQAQAGGLGNNSGWVYRTDLKEYRLLRRGDPLQTYQGFWYFSNVDGTLVFPAPAAPTS